MIPFLVLKTPGYAPISPAFSCHYQDLGITPRKGMIREENPPLGRPGDSSGRCNVIILVTVSTVRGDAPAPLNRGECAVRTTKQRGGMRLNQKTLNRREYALIRTAREEFALLGTTKQVGICRN